MSRNGGEHVLETHRSNKHLGESRLLREPECGVHLGPAEVDIDQQGGRTLLS
jgi:hypothetical protein